MSGPNCETESEGGGRKQIEAAATAAPVFGGCHRARQATVMSGLTLHESNLLSLAS